MTSSRSYYNENDPKAAAWLRELIKAGVIAPGDVDERSIEDVTPADLVGYTQCHFFAGIGGWSLALRLAGWSDNRPVWTGSCPCQPFSQAGKGGGVADSRHLWPAFGYLIQHLRPPVVFGEQVASPAGLAWLDLVQSDLERAAYAVGSADLCAAGVGAPHIRQRLYWVADTHGRDADAERIQRGRQHGQQSQDGSAFDWLGDTSSARSRRHSGEISGAEGGAERQVWSEFNESQFAGELDITPGSRLERFWTQPTHGESLQTSTYVDCLDGKRRPVEPGTFPLAHGVPGRVGLLRDSCGATAMQSFRKSRRRS